MCLRTFWVSTRVYAVFVHTYIYIYMYMWQPRAPSKKMTSKCQELTVNTTEMCKKVGLGDLGGVCVCACVRALLFYQFLAALNELTTNC